MKNKEKLLKLGYNLHLIKLELELKKKSSAKLEYR
jgi:hypothetical protein